MSKHIQQWRLLRNGDAKALEYFFRCFYQDMLQYSLGLLQDKATAEDQIQYFFLQLWEKHASLPEVTNARAYIFRALRFAIIDELRRQKRKRITLVDGSTFDWYSLPDSSENDALKLPFREMIQALSATQQEILFLRFYNQIPYTEIAEITNMRHQSVRNAAHRGIKKLRSLMNRDKEA